jgi:hypothetical protein
MLLRPSRAFIIRLHQSHCRPCLPGLTIVLKFVYFLQVTESPSTSNGVRTVVRSKRSQPLYVSDSEEEGDIQEQRSKWKQIQTKPITFW